MLTRKLRPPTPETPLLAPQDQRTIDRLASLRGPAKPTRVDAAVLFTLLAAGVALLNVGLDEDCVLKGIAGGLLVGVSLGLLFVLPYTRTLCAGRQLLLRIVTQSSPPTQRR